MADNEVQSPAAIAAQRSTDERLPPLDRRVIVGLFSGRRRNLNMVVSKKCNGESICSGALRTSTYCSLTQAPWKVLLGIQ